MRYNICQTSPLASHSTSFDINIGLIAYFNSLIDLSLDKHHNYLP